MKVNDSLMVNMDDLRETYVGFQPRTYADYPTQRDEDYLVVDILALGEAQEWVAGVAYSWDSR